VRLTECCETELLLLFLLLLQLVVVLLLRRRIGSRDEDVSA
jgi:hypothetical protein